MVQFFMLNWPIGLPTFFAPPPTHTHNFFLAEDTLQITVYKVPSKSVKKD